MTTNNRLYPDNTVYLVTSKNGTKYIYGLTSNCYEWLLEDLNHVLDAGDNVEGEIEITFLISEHSMQVETNGRFNAAQLRALANLLEKS